MKSKIEKRARLSPGLLLLRVGAVTAVAALASCLACGPEPLGIKEDCQPLLAGFDCMLPYPSDYFRVADATMPSGHRIEMGRSAGMLTKDGFSADVTDWREADGYSVFAPIVAVLGVALSDAGLVKIFDDYDGSTRLTSPTLLLEAGTGELIPHFVDLDPRATDLTRQALIIRPMRKLKFETRYLVALRDLRAADGQPAPAPEGFRRLRDDEVGQDPQLQKLQPHFDDKVFAPLETAGVERSELQLAWDFTTGTEEDITADMLRGRELALAALEASPPVIETITLVEDPTDLIWRRIEGKLRGPMVMEHKGPGAELSRDEQGRVKLNGTVEFSFSAMVPVSLRDEFNAGVSLEIGHGFFGSQSEVTNERSQRMANTIDSVLFGCDWWGMSSMDAGILVSAIGDEVWRSLAFSPRVVQGMANWLTLSAAVRGVFAEHPYFHRPDQPGEPGVVDDPGNPGQTNAGQRLYATDHTNFMGMSQGHILGGVYSALNPAIDRSILHVGGAGFTHMMFRAQPFTRYLFLMDISVPDPLDQQKLAASMQMQFDRIDPAIYARFVLDDELPSGPAGGKEGRKVLMQTAIADIKVPNFASYYHARLLGIPLLTPSVRDPWGLETVEVPHAGSAITLFDMGADDSFYARAEPTDENANVVHDILRSQIEPQAQIRSFLWDDVVVNPCDGACIIDCTVECELIP